MGSKKVNVSLIKQYLDYQIHYEKEYGEKTVVVMQVGAFFEIYGIDNEEEKIGNVDKVAKTLNIILSRKNRANLKNSIHNPLMCGFGIVYLDRHLNVLVNNDYTVILIEQDPRNKKKRDVTNIFSPGVNISNIRSTDPNNLVSIYIDIEKCFKSGKKLMILGCSSIDLSTSKNVINQSHELIDNKITLFEDLNRFLLIHNPIEIILNVCDNGLNLLDDILNSTNILSSKVHNTYGKNKDFSKVSFQNSFLSKFFKDTGGLTPIEYLDLEMKPTAVRSYLDLLQFCYEHSPTILNKLNEPEIWNHNEHLVLYNDVIYQLDLIRNNGHLKGNSKIKCLFDVVDKTQTSMGRRLLKYRLTNPITNNKKLQKRYDMIEIFINNKDCLKFLKNKLRKVIDIQRYFRKINLKCIHPFEFHSLNDSHENIIEIVDFLSEKYHELNIVDKNCVLQFKEFIKEYYNFFDVEEMGKYRLDNIDGNFIKKGNSSKIEEIYIKIINNEKIIETEKQRLNKLLGITKKNGTGAISLHISDKKEYNFITTKARYKVLENKNGFEYDMENKYEKKTVGNNIKFLNLPLRKIHKCILNDKQILKENVKEFYLNKLQYLSDKYNTVFDKISNIIAVIDVLQSSTYCALDYGYCKPKLIESEDSFFKCEEVRHPILERLAFTGEYITNDLNIGGEEKNGLLLYGVNGSGKSTLSKAIGLSIIMAQSGLYVPCKKFSLSVYNKIFTRITSNDNLFKGKSSFIVEMTELRSIIKFADKNSIVLGDEICKGTEYKSALSLIYASLNYFVNNKINFILATHFHKLYNLLDDNKEVKSNILFKHLSITRRDDMIIYGRKIIDGIGEDIYGLEIAKYIIDDEDFIKLAFETRNRILGVTGNILDDNKSNYNKDLYVDKCTVCGKGNNETQLDTHHIKEQHQFDENKLLGHIKKDNLDNLVVLCKYHHNEVHNGKLKINGYIHTNNGRYLDYEYLNKKNTNKKYSIETVEIIINKFKGKTYSKKYMLSCLKKDNNIKMSQTTLNKILKGTY